MLFGLKKQMKNTGELNIFPYVLLNVECEIAYWYNGIFFLFLFSSSSLFIYLFIFKSLRDFSKANEINSVGYWGICAVEQIYTFHKRP